MATKALIINGDDENTLKAVDGLDKEKITFGLNPENDYYAEACKKMPKVGSAVGTPEGLGTVVSNDMLKLITKVKIPKEDGSEVYKDFPVDKLNFKKNKNTDKSTDNDDETEVSEDMKKILD